MRRTKVVLVILFGLFVFLFLLWIYDKYLSYSISQFDLPIGPKFVMIFVYLIISYVSVSSSKFILKHLFKIEISIDKKSLADKPNKSLIKKVSLVFLLFAVSSLGLIIYFKFYSDTGLSSLINKHDIGDNSRYYSSNNKVYFDGRERDYLEISEADINTFMPFRSDLYKYSHYIQTARDKKHVYSGEKVILDLKPELTYYLGFNYISDKKKVFYKDNIIPDAEPYSFEVLSGQYILNADQDFDFGFAKDKNQVYYKEKVLPELNPQNVSIFGNNDSIKQFYPFLISDDKVVYYFDKRLQGLQPKGLNVSKIGYQRYFISDGQVHYINDYLFPEIVENRHFGSNQVNLNKLISLPSKSVDLSLFSDGKAIYYYDSSKKKAYHAIEIENAKPLSSFLFTDGQAVFFTERNMIRGRNYTSGESTTIYKLEIDPNLLVRIYSNEDFNVYRYKQNEIYLENLKNRSFHTFSKVKDNLSFLSNFSKNSRNFSTDDLSFPNANNILSIKVFW